MIKITALITPRQSGKSTLAMMPDEKIKSLRGFIGENELFGKYIE